jgi:hypothetical protein
LTGFVSISYIKYNNEQASYHRCIDRQTHLAEQYLFNENLLTSLDRAETLSEDEVEVMRSFIITPEGITSCPEPAYL